MSQVEDQLTCLSQDSPEALYQNEPQDYEEERYFSMLMESLGASNIFEEWVSFNVFDYINILFYKNEALHSLAFSPSPPSSCPSEVRTLWIQLRKDEPHLLYNFEEFLVRVTSQIRVAQQEKSEMECALRK